MRRTRAQRGQTLVLFGLTMLLLVVMVCMSLAIGMKAREKIELQTLADATAYSNAVATARTYNTISVWTRAQIAQMVVLAGAQSHISFTTWYMSTLEAARISALAQIVPCGAAATAGALVGFVFAQSCANLPLAAAKFSQELANVRNNFKSLDEAAGAEVKVMQGVAAAYGTAQKAAYAKLLLHQGQGGFADDFLKLAVPDDGRRAEYKVSTAANLISGRELGVEFGDNVGAYDNNSDPYPALPAAHGSRKSGFIRNRDWAIPVKLLTLLSDLPGGPVNFIAAYGDGTAHFGESMHSAHETNARDAWADDEGLFFGLVYGPGAMAPWPIPPLPWGTASIRSTDDKHNNDRHRWSPNIGARCDAPDVHDLGDCGKECPSVWVGRAEYNLDPRNSNQDSDRKPGTQRDQWRQPKTLIALERDYEARTVQDPWNLMFNLRLQPGDQAQVDLGKQRNPEGRFKQQGAISAAITYYHRHMGSSNASYYWDEPPNFFNPFWRATLVAPDLDERADFLWGKGDLETVLGAMDLSFAGAYTGMTTAGFDGVQ